MKRQGITEYKLERTNPVTEEDIRKTLTVEWEYESSEYGDGSTDTEFTTRAFTKEGEEVELTDEEEMEIFEDLESDGEFA